MGNHCGRCCSSLGPTPIIIIKDGTTQGDRTHRVQVAVSEVFRFGGIMSAFHSSILVNGAEYFFAEGGILLNVSASSHEGGPMEIIDFGMSSRDGKDLVAALRPHFASGSYDPIRKNCNNFSDCALYFLVGARLHPRYSSLERLGQQASADVIRRFVDNSYNPNPDSEGFSAEEVIVSLERMCQASLRGHALNVEGGDAPSFGTKMTLEGCASLKKSPTLDAALSLYASEHLELC
eukprot:NODE_19728_length_830_cov_3.331437.p1 GENE.NODE_19728_length_830_cov_3.331437~~NODE_19728_length_830_cov_3.331437.p1  ORF type:complete len:252 (+),score=44.58 NODE_19728_length_830_cov_3.331437:52-756(+)